MTQLLDFRLPWERKLLLCRNSIPWVQKLIFSLQIINYFWKYVSISHLFFRIIVLYYTNTTGIISGAVTANPSRALEFILSFSRVRVAWSLVLCVVFCRSLFLLLYFLFCPLGCLPFFDVWIYDFYYSFGIFQLFLLMNLLVLLWPANFGT